LIDRAKVGTVQRDYNYMMMWKIAVFVSAFAEIILQRWPLEQGLHKRRNTGFKKQVFLRE
jgi:hypothetical protein